MALSGGTGGTYTPVDVDMDKLTTPFPQHALKQREGGRGKMLTYVEGHTVIHRLNDVTGNHWDFKVLDFSATPGGSTRDGKPQTLYTATVELCIPGLGCRQHVGVQLSTEGGGEDLVKGAVTDGLKKAATLFGVGLELYGPDYEAGEVSHSQEVVYIDNQGQAQRGGGSTVQSPAAQMNKVNPSTSYASQSSVAQSPQRTYPKPDANRVHNANGEEVPTHTQGGASIRSLNRALAICNKTLHMSDEARHKILQEKYGKGSLNDLTQPEMSNFNDYLNGLVELTKDAS